MVSKMVTKEKTKNEIESTIEYMDQDFALTITSKNLKNTKDTFRELFTQAKKDMSKKVSYLG